MIRNIYIEGYSKELHPSETKIFQDINKGLILADIQFNFPTKKGWRIRLYVNSAFNALECYSHQIPKDGKVILSSENIYLDPKSHIDLWITNETDKTREVSFLVRRL